ncbi:MAG TPA: alternative ribosome rescue aminoacyl-tRNA hydrolase ArfB [Oculatellaceae cyanobacterium]
MAPDLDENALIVSASAPRVVIPLSEFEFSFSRSGGPGGQNVNKVNSKAVMRWAITSSQNLPEDIRNRFLAKFASRITTDGELIITSQRYRDQPSNVDDCLQKVQNMVAEVLHRPELRRPTKPTFASKQKRVESKRENARKKQMRRASFGDD